MSKQYDTATDYSKLPRSDKLYILSQICIRNVVTPDTPGYVGLIIKVCTSQFALSKEKAKEYADDLKTAYEADKWEGLAHKYKQMFNEEPQETTVTPRTFDEQPKTLDVLNNLNFKSSAPIKRIKPKNTALEPDFAPVTVAQQLMNMAKNNDFNGVGRITLAEARWKLEDKALKCEDLIRLIKQYYPQVDVEQRPGNIVLVYFDGKDTTKNVRSQNRVAPVTPILLRPYFVDYPKLEFEKDAETASKEKFNIPEGTDQIDETEEICEEE
jgi:hypothetical protein